MHFGAVVAASAYCLGQYVQLTFPLLRGEEKKVLK